MLLPGQFLLQRYIKIIIQVKFILNLIPDIRKMVSIYHIKNTLIAGSTYKNLCGSQTNGKGYGKVKRIYLPQCRIQLSF